LPNRLSPQTENKKKPNLRNFGEKNHVKETVSKELLRALLSLVHIKFEEVKKDAGEKALVVL